MTLIKLLHQVLFFIKDPFPQTHKVTPSNSVLFYKYFHCEHQSQAADFPAIKQQLATSPCYPICIYLSSWRTHVCKISNITALLAICRHFLPIERKLPSLRRAVFQHPGSFWSCNCSNHQPSCPHADLPKPLIDHAWCFGQVSYLTGAAPGSSIICCAPPAGVVGPACPLGTQCGSEVPRTSSNGSGQRCSTARLQGEFLKINYSTCKMQLEMPKQQGLCWRGVGGTGILAQPLTCWMSRSMGKWFHLCLPPRPSPQNRASDNAHRVVGRIMWLSGHTVYIMEVSSSLLTSSSVCPPEDLLSRWPAVILSRRNDFSEPLILR